MIVRAKTERIKELMLSRDLDVNMAKEIADKEARAEYLKLMTQDILSCEDINQVKYMLANLTDFIRENMLNG